MSNLWIPEEVPPQVSPEAYQAVSERLLTDGLDRLYSSGARQLDHDQELIGDYIAELGDELSTTNEIPWRKRVLKIGSAVSLVAYRETGYYQTIDEVALAVGKFVAELDGVPDTYLRSAVEDPVLLEVIDTVLAAPEFSQNSSGFRHALTIGAGCTRHFIQQALAA